MTTCYKPEGEVFLVVSGRHSGEANFALGEYFLPLVYVLYILREWTAINLSVGIAFKAQFLTLVRAT